MKLESNIKKYCETHRIKFENYTDLGFVASLSTTIKAGMKIDLHTSKILSFPIRAVRKKTLFREFICYLDGDIIDNGFCKNKP